MRLYYEEIVEACEAACVVPTADCLYVLTSEQKMYHFRQGSEHKVYQVSTSREPPSNVNGSLGTPPGLHEICAKIGGEQPYGMVFRGRRPTGQLFYDLSGEENRENLITSRILWLSGLEPGRNEGGGVDTRERYIYIHGTNQEEHLGLPNSHGCILMNNAEIIKLYPQLEEGTIVLVAG